MVSAKVNNSNSTVSSSSSGRSGKIAFYIIAGLLGAGILLPISSAFLHEQRVEAKRRAIAVAGGKSELARVVPDWLKSIAGENFHSFLDQTTITRVNMNGDKVGDAQVASVTAVENLEMLDLETSLVTSQGLTAVAQLKELRYLNLSQTKVTDISQLAALPKLDNLNISFSTVRDANLNSISTFPALKFLDAGGLILTDTGVAEIGKCTSLETLSIRGCQLSPNGLKPLHALKSLKALNLSNSVFDPADLAALKEALVNCDISV